MVREKLSGLNTNFKTNSKSRYEFFIFLLCVILSLITWLMIELSKEHTAEVSYPLHYINLEKRNLLISDVPNSINVLITDNGYKIAKMKYFEKLDTLIIDVTRLRLSQEGNIFNTWLRSREVINYNHKELINKKVSAIRTDTLFMKFETLSEKKVKVIPNLSLSFANGYEQADSILVQPQKISIKGYEEALNSIDYIKTDYCKIKDIKSIQKLYIKIAKVKNDKILYYSNDSVKIIVPVKNSVLNE